LQQEIAPPNSVDTRITADNLRSGFNVWRTHATSPSVNTSDTTNPFPPSRAVQRTTVFSHQRRIFGVLADVIDAAMQTGFVFDSAKIVNAMIEKIPGHH
jgi:hypothetical protein